MYLKGMSEDMARPHKRPTILVWLILKSALKSSKRNIIGCRIVQEGCFALILEFYRIDA